MDLRRYGRAGDARSSAGHNALLYGDAVLLADILSKVITPSLQRIVAFSSTSVMTKLDTEVAAEREILRNLAEAEQRIIATCEQHRIGWTILRPTLIYKEGHDINITPLSRLIRRFRFMPLVGGGTGLRQPVHAEDLAIGAIAAAGSPAAVNKIYCLPGGETISYREMIGRIFTAPIAPPHDFNTGGAVANGVRAGASVVSGRECGDGPAHDQGHDLRRHAGHSKISAGIRARSIRFAMRFLTRTGPLRRKH